MTRVPIKKLTRPKLAVGVPLPEGAKERDLEDLVLLHLAALPWCRFWRNKERHVQTFHGPAYFPGLAMGSADLIGVVARVLRSRSCGDPVVVRESDGSVFAMTVPVRAGIFTAIELKQPGSYKKPRKEQNEWGELVQRMGGVWGWADNVDGALEIVARARGVPLEDVREEIFSQQKQDQPKGDHHVEAGTGAAEKNGNEGTEQGRRSRTRSADRPSRKVSPRGHDGYDGDDA